MCTENHHGYLLYYCTPYNYDYLCCTVKMCVPHLAHTEHMFFYPIKDVSGKDNTQYIY